MQKTIYRNTTIPFSLYTADFLKNKIKSILAETNTKVSIALSGGNTPLPILDLLKDKDVQWERLQFFMVDERCVLLDDRSCNFTNINNVFFKYIPSKSFSMLNENSSYEESVIRYQEILKKELPVSDKDFPVFDLIILGIGDDGHTASLFPNTRALNENTKTVVLNEVPQLGAQRITLSYPVILNSKEILVLLKGERKAGIIEEIYSGKGTSYPIYKVAKEHSNLKWLIG